MGTGALGLQSRLPAYRVLMETRWPGQPRAVTSRECGTGCQTGLGDSRKGFQSTWKNTGSVTCTLVSPRRVVRRGGKSTGGEES